MQRNGFIRIFTLTVIIAGILITGGIGYLGLGKYKNYQIQKAKQEQDGKNAEQQTLKYEIGKLQKEIEGLKNQKPEVIIKEVAPKELDLVAIIDRWRPRIASIECEFRYTNGVLYGRSSGSGILYPDTDFLLKGGVLKISTNKHIVTVEEKYGPYMCSAKFPEYNNILKFYQTDADIIISSQYDVAELKIDNPDEYFVGITKFSSPYHFEGCSNKASVGDDIVILGYPSIGSKTDITATKGIISGYDGYYYITDAKIEQGNSGGAAILLKNNCYLGIPSFAMVGDIESLSRVLDWTVTWK